MGDGTKTIAADDIDQHPLLFQRGDDRRGTQAVADHLEDDDICIDILRANFDCRNVLQLSRQPLGMVVVHSQSLDMVLKRIDTGGGEDAGLPHCAAIHAPQPLGLLEQGEIIHQQEGTDRRPQPFGETD